MEDDVNIEKAHRYLSGEMSPAERQAFEADMEKNEELRQAVLREQQLLEALERSFDDQVKEDIGQVHRQLEAQGFFTKARRPSGRRVALRAGLAAAVVALCFGIWWLAVRPASSGPALAFREHFRPETTKVEEIIGELTSVGFTPEMNREDSLREALALYRDGRYPQAANALEGFLNANPQNDTARFYLALAEMSLSKFESAAGRLYALARQDNFTMADDAQWYLALAYLQTEGNWKEARRILRQLADKDNSGRQAEARRLLEKMEKD